MKAKLKEWLRRYLPAEVLSVAATMLCGMAVYRAGGSMLSVALAGTWGGNIAYYSYILTADVACSLKRYRMEGAAYTTKSFIVNVRSLVIEFGTGEFIDSLFVRPLLMYYIPVLMSNVYYGMLVAKIAADVCFYIPTIISYEAQKKMS